MQENSETVVDTVDQPEVAAIVEAQPQPVELPEKSHTYQPTDEQGRALGGKQVIKYRTTDELIGKMTDQNVLLVRKLREQTKRQRLGIATEESIPDSAQRFDTPLQFTPRDLTAEERIKINHDLLDPAHVNEALDTLFEAAVGAKPSVISQALTEQKIELLRMKAEMESKSFASKHPKYFPCRENWEAMTNWMLKNDLAPVRDNFALAYETLTDAGVLLQAPPEVEVPQPSEQPPVVTVIEPPAPPAPPEPVVPKAAPVVPIASGLTREQASDISVTPRSVGDEMVYDKPILDRSGKPTGQSVRYTGLAAIDMMPGDEFARRVKADKNFNQKYEQLLREQEQKRRGA